MQLVPGAPRLLMFNIIIFQTLELSLCGAITGFSIYICAHCQPKGRPWVN